MKSNALVPLYEILPENEKIIVDVLRQIIKENLPPEYGEKISYGVPFFYGNRGICIVWPATVPRGGIKLGVLLGFWYGNQLEDLDQYLTDGYSQKLNIESPALTEANRIIKDEDLHLCQHSHKSHVSSSCYLS